MDARKLHAAPYTATLRSNIEKLISNEYILISSHSRLENIVNSVCHNSELRLNKSSVAATALGNRVNYVMTH